MRPDQATLAMELSRRVHPLFAGVDELVVGGALADLLATYIASHFARDHRSTYELRLELLHRHMQCVIEMIPACEQQALDSIKHDA